MGPQPFDIAGRRVGPGHPCFIIAEAGVNHNGDLDMARRLVEIAAESGADAVKFQTFNADRLVSAQAPKADYQLRTTDAGESQHKMIRRLELTEDMHRDLMACCRKTGILFLSSPFDEGSADLLADLDVAAYKVPSGEITNLRFLAHIARKGKPMIISTGMADLNEVEAAVKTVLANGNRHFTLLQCTSNYPADPADANLRAMSTMANAFGVPVGYSDHTPGIEVPLAAVALGASVVEKHFTLNRGLPGPDHAASVEPGELAALVEGIRIVESALGHGRKEPSSSEANTAEVARKSLVAAQHIPAGVKLTDELLTLKRPGNGLAPSMRERLIGRSVKVDVPKDTLLTLDMLE